VLRPLQPGDEQDLLAYRRRADVCRYIPSDPLTEATAADFITERMRLTQITKDGDRLILAIELAGQVIGDLLVRGGALPDRQTEANGATPPSTRCSGQTGKADDLARSSPPRAGLASRSWFGRRAALGKCQRVNDLVEQFR
jgi:hypothetical protein